MLPPKTNRSRTASAFSLVEIAIAIAILSVGVVSIIGLLPVAMNSSRQSADRICEIRMLETVRAALLGMPSSELNGPIEFTFDVEGEQLTGPAQTGARRYYTIETDLQATTQLPGTQTTAKLFTAQLKIKDLIRHQERTASLHLPYNGY
jgi:uncharacterized protein (TIGR02598 family)